tara:strand:- start:106 stop:612 length:507 start_codon:yes stop_codon:yes gene_type:complete
MLLGFLKSSALFVFCLILSRFIGLPSNFTPIIAFASFLPFLTNNRYIQLFLPVGVLIITDPFLGFHSSMPVVYFCIFISSVLAVLSKSLTFKNLIMRGVISVFFWHIFVNFSVWLSGGLGFSLLKTYMMAIPFDFQLLLSTVFFSSLFYFSRELFINFYNRANINSKG